MVFRLNGIISLQSSPKKEMGKFFDSIQECKIICLFKKKKLGALEFYKKKKMEV
jgi:hypothetical protein